jgi:hypothetical protein
MQLDTKETGNNSIQTNKREKRISNIYKSKDKNGLHLHKQEIIYAPSQTYSGILQSRYH